MKKIFLLLVAAMCFIPSFIYADLKLSQEEILRKEDIRSYDIPIHEQGFSGSALET